MNHQKTLLSKVLPKAKIAPLVCDWRNAGKKIVFTNGCFDLLHLGHVDYLSKARGYGDKLVVGLNSDASIKKLKGSSRPIKDERSRSWILASFAFVDAVVLFDDETPLELISQINPDVLVKGGDYSTDEIVGNELVSSAGGQVLTVPFVKGFSSTNFIDKIINEANG